MTQKKIYGAVCEKYLCKKYGPAKIILLEVLYLLFLCNIYLSIVTRKEIHNIRKLFQYLQLSCIYILLYYIYVYTNLKMYKLSRIIYIYLIEVFRFIRFK